MGDTRTDNRYRGQRGQSLIEVLVAVAIFGVFALAVTAVLLDSLVSSRVGVERETALASATEGVEAARQIRHRSWSALGTGTKGVAVNTAGSETRYEFSGSSDTQGIFQRSVTVDQVQRDVPGNIVESGGAVDPDTRKVTARTQWGAALPLQRAVNLTTYLTNWNRLSWVETLLSQFQQGTLTDTEAISAAAPPTDNGSVILRRLITGASSLGVRGAVNFNATGPSDGRDVAYAGGYAYMVTSLGVGNARLYVVDVSVANSPQLVSATSLGAKLYSIAVSGRYAYIGTDKSTGELRVVDISNPSAPVAGAEVDLPGTTSVLSVAVNGPRLFAGTSAASPTFYAFSLTDPASPTLTLSRQLEGSPDVRGIHPLGDRVYVATSADTAEIQIIDVAGITNGAPASDALGQTDDSLSSPAPIYTKGAAHNAPNRLGLFVSEGKVFLDGVGDRLFVTDTQNNRVLVYNLNPDDTLPDRVPDNVLGQANFYTNTFATTQSGMFWPYDAAYDSANSRLFVAERLNNRVTVFDVTTITNGENAVNVLGQANFTSGLSATTQSGMWGPAGLAYDSATNRLFAVEITNSRVTVFDVAAITNGEDAVNVLGQANFTSRLGATTQSGMHWPYGAAYDSTNSRLFVAELLNRRVTVFNLADGLTNGEDAVNVLGQSFFTTNTAATTQAGMNGAVGLAYDSANTRLFVADTGNQRVTVFNVATITDGEDAINVLGQANFTSSTGASTQSGMSGPSGLSYNSANARLFVAEQGNNRVTVFDVATIANGENAIDALGQYDQVSLTAPSPIYTKAGANDSPNRLGLNDPYAVLVDTVDHRAFVADRSNNRVLVYALNANDTLPDRVPDNVLGQANFYSNAPATTQSSLNRPEGLAHDSVNKRLFVASFWDNRVLVYNLADGITNGENAVNVLGQSDFTSSISNTTQSGLFSPRGLAYDSASSRLFVAENNNHRVTVFNVATITNGEDAINVLGQPGFITNDPVTSQSGLYFPSHLAYDSANTRLFVADAVNNRVIVYHVATITNGENATNVIGQKNFIASTAATTQSGLSAPFGLAHDGSTSRLLVGDAGNNRVTVYDVTVINNGEDAINVLGQANFTSSAAATTQSGMRIPRGLSYDSTNKLLYVVDSSNRRVTVYDAAVPTGGGIIGTEDLPGISDATNLVVSGKRIYVTRAGDNQFVILNLDNPLDPAPLSSLSLGVAANDLFVSGSYAYVAAETDNEFIRVNMNNVSTPFVEGTVNLDGAARAVAFTGACALVATNGNEQELAVICGVGSADPLAVLTAYNTLGTADGRAVALQGTLAYVGTDDAFYVFNVNQPGTPVLLGQTSSAAPILDVAVSGSFVYLATSKTDAELSVVDVADPTSPGVIGTYDTPEAGRSVAAYGSTIFLGTGTGGSPGALYAFSVSSPSAPSLVGSLSMTGTLTDIAMGENNIAYVTLARTSDSAEIERINVANPVAMTASGSYNAPGADNGTGVFVSADSVYLVTGDKSGITPEFYILDDTGISLVLESPGSALDIGGPVNAVVQHDVLAYLATSISTREFQVLDVTDHGSPVLRNFINLGGAANGVVISGTYGYLATARDDQEFIILKNVDSIGYTPAGTYQSIFFDAVQSRLWERIGWNVLLNGGTISFQVRWATPTASYPTCAAALGVAPYMGPSGDVAASYTVSDTAITDAAGQPPAAQCFQWRATLNGTGNASPELRDVTITFTR